MANRFIVIGRPGRCNLPRLSLVTGTCTNWSKPELRPANRGGSCRDPFPRATSRIASNDLATHTQQCNSIEMCFRSSLEMVKLDSRHSKWPICLYKTASVREKRETMLDDKMRYDVALQICQDINWNCEFATTLFPSTVLQYG